VRGSDRSILVTYKIKDRQDETKEIVRTSTVTSEKEIETEIQTTMTVIVACSYHEISKKCKKSCLEWGLNP